MGTYQPTTLDMIAQALTARPQTPREIEAILPLSYGRSTIRAVLGLLLAEGRAIAEGDVLQKRYRLAGQETDPCNP